MELQSTQQVQVIDYKVEFDSNENEIELFHETSTSSWLLPDSLFSSPEEKKKNQYVW